MIKRWIQVNGIKFDHCCGMIKKHQKEMKVDIKCVIINLCFRTCANIRNTYNIISSSTISLHHNVLRFPMKLIIKNVYWYTNEISYHKTFGICTCIFKIFLEIQKGGSAVFRSLNRRETTQRGGWRQQRDNEDQWSPKHLLTNLKIEQHEHKFCFSFLNFIWFLSIQENVI